MGYELAAVAREVEALGPGQSIMLEGLEADIYHKAPGIGSTAMRAASQSMAHYDSYMNGSGSMLSSITLKNMRIGSATHCLILEPQRFNERYAVMPPDIKQRRGEKWDEFVQSVGSAQILSEDENDLSNCMASALRRSNAAQFFRNGQSEVSFFKRHETGLLLKARVDYMVGDLGVDLKTTSKEKPDDFAVTVKYEYNIQDALYRLVTGINDFIFVGICKKKPHEIFTAKQGAKPRQAADKLLEETITSLVAAREFGEFNPKPIKMVETDLSAWELSQLENA